MAVMDEWRLVGLGLGGPGLGGPDLGGSRVDGLRADKSRVDTSRGGESHRDAMRRDGRGRDGWQREEGRDGFLHGVPATAGAAPLPRPRVSAEPLPATGFPSPADDHAEACIDLNLELIPRPLSTFLMRVQGDAMRADGILDGDLLVIDRSLTPRPGCLVVAVWHGTFILRRLQRQGQRLLLVASDGCSPALPLRDCGAAGSEGEQGAELWGVAIHAVHHLAGAPSRRH